MATYYADSSATGANDGSSKADAFTSLASRSFAKGDICYVSHTHSETVNNIQPPGTNNAYNDPPVFISVDFTGSTPPVAADYTKGAKLNGSTGQVNFNNAAVYHGFIFEAGADIDFNLFEAVTLIDCDISNGTDDDFIFDGTGFFVLLQDCTLKSSDASSANNTGGLQFTVTDGGHLRMEGCTFDSSLGYKGDLITSQGATTTIEFIGCDLSGWGVNNGGTKELHSSSTQQTKVRFVGCKMPSPFAIGPEANAFASAHNEMIGCGENDNTSQEQYELHSGRGTVSAWGGGIASRAVYHNNGFTPPHQTNAISLRMLPKTAQANQDWPLRSPPIIAYNSATGATKTLTVEILLADASAVDPLDYTQVWLEVFYYAATGTLLKFETSKELRNKATPTNLPAGTGVANWTVTNAAANRGSYKVQLTTSQNVAQAGQIMAHVCVGDAGSNDQVFIDPLLTIT